MDTTFSEEPIVNFSVSISDIDKTFNRLDRLAALSSASRSTQLDKYLILFTWSITRLYGVYTAVECIQNSRTVVILVHYTGWRKKRGHRPSYLIANIPKTP